MKPLGHHDAQCVVFQSIMSPNMEQRVSTRNNTKRVKLDDMYGSNDIIGLVQAKGRGNGQEATGFKQN